MNNERWRSWSFTRLLTIMPVHWHHSSCVWRDERSCLHICQVATRMDSEEGLLVNMSKSVSGTQSSVAFKSLSLCSGMLFQSISV